MGQKAPSWETPSYLLIRQVIFLPKSRFSPRLCISTGKMHVIGPILVKNRRFLTKNRRFLGHFLIKFLNEKNRSKMGRFFAKK